MKFVNEEFLIKLRKGIITIGLCAGISASLTACNQNSSETPVIEIGNEVTPELEGNVENNVPDKEPEATPIITPTETPTATPIPTPIEEVIEVDKVNVLKEQLLTRIEELSEKYPALSYEHIRDLVVGANLDCVDEEVVYEILGISSASELEPFSESYERAIVNLGLAVFHTAMYKDFGYDKPKVDYAEVPKIADLLFDDKLIEHAQYFDNLSEELAYDSRGSDLKVGNNFVGYVLNYYSPNYDGYLHGETYSFEDETNIPSAKKTIDLIVLNLCASHFSGEQYGIGSMSREEAFEYFSSSFANAGTPFSDKMENVKTYTR